MVLVGLMAKQLGGKRHTQLLGAIATGVDSYFSGSRGCSAICIV